MKIALKKEEQLIEFNNILCYLCYTHLLTAPLSKNYSALREKFTDIHNELQFYPFEC